METPPDAAPRRGRLPTAQREAREQAIADAAMAELVEHGFEGVTMLKVAKRAGASKETLYNWFGNRDGLFETLITRNGERAAAGVRAALDSDGSPQQVLQGFAVGLLTLLTRPESVALNRAAMTSPDLAQLLLAGGRNRVGPLVEHYLAELHEQGVINSPDPTSSFRLLYGLVIEDAQIQVLLGEDAPTPKAIKAHAGVATERFFALLQADPATT